MFCEWCDNQLCSGIDENAVGASAQLIFAPVDVALTEDIPLLPSGFCISPVDANVLVRFTHFSAGLIFCILSSYFEY